MTRIDGALISAVKYFRPKSEHNDDHILSSVHFKLSFGVVLGCAILTGLTSWYSPIECTKPEGAMFELSYVKQWCYANSTFIVQGSDPKNQIFQGVSNKAGEKVVFIRYYQWVTLCLVIQAACFQVPRILWKSMEGGRTRMLVDQLRELERGPIEEKRVRLPLLAYRFRTRRHDDNIRFFKWFTICQVLYFLNITFQIALTHSFLNGHFISLMIKWLAGHPVLDAVFPKMVKCELLSYGTGGSPQHQNVLCLLATNVLNEKIYLLLWGVFMLALVISIVQLAYVAMTMSSWRFRNATLHIDEAIDKAPGVDNANLSHGEWLLLKFVKENLDDSQLFDDFVYELVKVGEGQEDADQQV